MNGTCAKMFWSDGAEFSCMTEKKRMSHAAFGHSFPWIAFGAGHIDSFMAHLAWPCGAALSYAASLNGDRPSGKFFRGSVEGRMCKYTGNSWKKKKKNEKSCLSTETGIVFCKKMGYPEIWKIVWGKHLLFA